MQPYDIESMLKEGHKHMFGLDEAILKNIDACKQLSTITRTSLGPNVMESATQGQSNRSDSDESKLSVSPEKLEVYSEDKTSVSDSSANLQPPPIQSMDCSAPYRISSFVFARSSAAPGDWSTASNESLFSIQMGNMSFTREYIQYLGNSRELGMSESNELGLYKKSRELSMYKKSGDLGAEQYKSMELGVSGEPRDMRPTTTGQMMNLSNCPQSAYQAGPNSHPGVVFAEAAAAETMKEVIRENEQSRCETKELSQKNGTRSRTASDDGGASVKSFAFPV